MGTTPLGIRYPEPGEDLRNAASHQRALAEDVDGLIDPTTARLQIDLAESAGATGGAVDFPGTEGHLIGFARAGNGFTYSGPTRAFIIDVEVETQRSAVGGGDSSLALLLNGVQAAGSYDRIDDASGVAVARFYVHRITKPIVIGTGWSIDVTCGGTAGTLGKTAISIFPIGPAE